MTWLAQVAHIIHKDIRQARALLTLNVAVVALATAHAFGVPMLTNGLFELSSLFVVASGMLLAGALVQADSPTQSDAFWTSRPFYPSAMLVSKLLYMLVLVIGIGVVGECAALRALDVPIRDSLLVLAKAVEIYAIWLMIALVAAALTRDLRSFIVVLMFAGLALIVVLSATLTGEQLALISSMRTALSSLGFIGSVVLLALLYRTHDTRRRIWLGGIGFAICMLAIIVVPPPPSDTNSNHSEQVVGMRIDVVNASLLAPAGQLTIRLYGVGLGPSERFIFAGGPALIYPRGGERLTVEVNSYPGGATRLVQPEITGVRWLEKGPVVDTSADITLSLNAHQTEALAAGIDSVTLNGTMNVQYKTVSSMPLQENARLLSSGTRFSIAKLRSQPEDISLDLHTTSVGAPRNPMPLNMNFNEYSVDLALINNVRGEAIALHSTGSATGLGSLVLPGADLRETVSHYKLGAYSGAQQKPFGVDAAWSRAARVEVTQWTLKGSYPVHASSGAR